MRIIMLKNSCVCLQDGTTNSELSNGNTSSKLSREQTNPPSIPICELYPDGNYPEGEILEHPTPKHGSVNG